MHLCKDKHISRSGWKQQGPEHGQLKQSVGTFGWLEKGPRCRILLFSLLAANHHDHPVHRNRAARLLFVSCIREKNFVDGSGLHRISGSFRIASRNEDAEELGF
jgi:hypothetical protein